MAATGTVRSATRRVAASGRPAAGRAMSGPGGPGRRGLTLGGVGGVGHRSGRLVRRRRTGGRTGSRRGCGVRGDRGRRDGTSATGDVGRGSVDVVGPARPVLAGHEDRRHGLGPGGVDGAAVGGVDQSADRLAVDGLLVEQGPGHGVEAAPVPCQHLEGALLLGPEDLLDLVVDDLAGVLGVVPRVHEVLAQEDLALRAPRHGADLVAHAPLADHLAGQLGVADEVVAGTGRQVAVDEQLGGPPAHAHGERVLDVLARVDVALLHRQLHGDAEGHAGRQDGDLVDRVGVGQHVGQHGVAALVEGDPLLLGVGQHQALAALAHQHPVARTPRSPRSG